PGVRAHRRADGGLADEGTAPALAPALICDAPGARLLRWCFPYPTEQGRTMTALSAETVSSLAGGDLPLAVPQYDRSRLRAGIVHLGVGGFHRAHQAMYLDRLMNAGEALDWAICGVGVLPHDARMRDALTAQDGLYTLVLKHPDGTLEGRVIGSIVEFLLAPDDPEAVIEKMAAPEV